MKTALLLAGSAAAAAAAPADWSLVESKVDEVSLTFAIKADAEALHSAFTEHTRPGQIRPHLSRAEVAKVAGTAEGAEYVVRRLKMAGATHAEVTPGSDFVRATFPEDAAEALLRTDFAVYQHGPTGTRSTVGAAQQLPADLAERVHFVSKNRFPTLSRRHAPTLMDSNGDDGPDANEVTPASLREFYNVDVTDAGGLATAGVFASLNQSYAQADLDQFLAALDLPGTTFEEHGPNDPSACDGEAAFENCGEAELDVETLSGIAPNLKSASFWSYLANEEGNEPFNDFMVELLSLEEPPQVVSMSYGDDERDVALEEMLAYDENAMKLGLMGTTVIASSGDDGAAGYYIRTDPDTACSFWVGSFPASSPYTTAVGATQGPESGADEIVCQSNEGGVITSGGGFSTVFPMPDYQVDAVAGWQASGDVPPEQYFNASGRAYPDVSLLGFNYYTILGGAPAAVSGTSASAPAFAALVSLINAHRLADGKPTVGFLNTNLYDLAAQEGQTVFNDITQGINNCGAGHDVSDLNCCDTGYGAVAGFDPATGLGSVDFPSMREAFADL